MHNFDLTMWQSVSSSNMWRDRGAEGDGVLKKMEKRSEIAAHGMFKRVRKR